MMAYSLGSAEDNVVRLEIMQDYQKIADQLGIDHPLWLSMSFWYNNIPTYPAYLADPNLRSKILSKVSGVAEAGEDAQRDLIRELEMGCLLTTVPDSSLSYEPYGKAEPGPDYRLTTAEGIVEVEVTRRQEADLERRFQKFLDELDDEYSTMTAGVDVTLHLRRWDSDTAGLTAEYADVHERARGLVQRLYDSKVGLVEFIRQAVADFSSASTTAGQSAIVAVPGFDDFDLLLMRYQDSTSPSGSVTRYKPSFYKLNEPLRICDAMCIKLRQFRDNTPNILALYSEASTLHVWHVNEAFDILANRASEGDDEFFRKRDLDGAGDFVRKFGRLSALWFRTRFFTERQLNGDSRWIGPEGSTYLRLNDLALSPLSPWAARHFERLPIPYPGD